MQWYLKDRGATDALIDSDIARSCTSKQQYADEADARAHALMNGMGDVLFPTLPLLRLLAPNAAAGPALTRAVR